MHSVTKRLGVFDFLTDAEKYDVVSGAGLLDLKASIQAAENALGAGELHFCAGVWRFDSTVLLSSGVHVVGAGIGATVFRPIYNFTMFANDVIASRNPASDTTPATAENQPDHDISVTGCTFDMRSTTGVASPTPLFTGDVATPVRFYYARNVAVTWCEIIGLDEPVLSGGAWIGSSGEWVGQAVDGFRVANNKMHGSLLAVDVWQGSRNVWIENNDIVLSNNETAHRGNSYCIGVNARGTLPEDHKTLENVFVRNNHCVLGGWGTGGIQFDTLSAGSIGKKVIIEGNVIIGRSGGTNQQGIYGRGRLYDVTVAGNKIEGVQSFPLLVAALFSTGGPFSGTNCIATTNGSNQAVVTLASMFPSKVTAGNWLLFGSGTSAVAGVAFASKYFPVIAIDALAGTATVQTDVAANATTTGGGSVAVNVYWGAPDGVSIVGNQLRDCSYPSNALITAVGQGVQVGGNRSIGGTYSTFASTSNVIAGVATGQAPSLWGNSSP